MYQSSHYSTCLALSWVSVDLLAAVAGREHVARQAAQRVYVVVEEDQNDRVDGGVGPRQERQQLVDFRRLLELGVDQRQDVERIPGEDEENGDENQDPRSTEGLTHNGAYQTLPGHHRRVAARYGYRRAHQRRQTMCPVDLEQQMFVNARLHVHLTLRICIVDLEKQHHASKTQAAIRSVHFTVST